MAEDAGTSFKGLRLHNTLAREKQDFVPLDPANVRMYVCGPTVYDFAHIGNARPLIVFDVLFRLLKHLYGPDRVTYARNITDIDDKIIARAAEEGVSVDEVTARTTKQFHEDVAALGCLQPTHEPRATQHIPQMIEMIGRLIEKGCAYEAEKHVLFDVAAFADYGKLSNRSTDETIASARVEVAPYKKNPTDFVLWKPSTPEQPGWDSPWGRGRPGWHLECSAMSAALLGETFDIHGGGIDLVFPHHENEIAQSRCAFHTPLMAKYWLHNGYLQVEGEKMSKSAGNFVTVHDLLHTEKFGGRDWPGEVLRMAMLSTHYRRPLDFSVRGLKDARNRWKRWGRTCRNYPTVEPIVTEAFIEVLLDDLNTPAALRLLSRYGSEASGVFFGSGPPPAESTTGNLDGVAKLKGCAAVLGLSFDETAVSQAIEEDIVDSLIAARLAARAEKNWAEADRIRDELVAMGIVLMDRPDGTTEWEVAR